jgi:hypothetical protein
MDGNRLLYFSVLFGCACFILLIILSYVYIHNFDFLDEGIYGIDSMEIELLSKTVSPPTYKNIKRLFPEKKYKSFTWSHTYDILKIELEQSGLPKCAIIQTYYPKKKIYQLWSLLPFSVSPPPQILYQSPVYFTWSTNDSLNIVVLSEILSSTSVAHKDRLSIKIFEQTEMKKGTLGSWHQRQIFTLEVSARSSTKKMNTENNPLHISISTNGKTIFANNNSGVYALFQLEPSPVEYYFQRMMMDKTKIDFQVFPHCIHYEEELIIVASPFFKQTDGVVDIYHFPQKDLDLYSISLQQSIIPPVRAGYFGGHCALANITLEHHLNSIVFLFVAAPFAPDQNNMYGAGSLFVYQYQSNQFQLSQIIYCPETLSFSETSILNFGYIFDVSQNGEWLAISTRSNDHGVIYMFYLDKSCLSYRYKQKFISSSPEPHQFGKALSIDNCGTLLIADKNSVYFSFGMNNFVPDEGIKTVILKPDTPRREKKLRNYSPNQRKRSKNRHQSKS